MNVDRCDYVAVGVSHHTAPVGLRERFAVASSRMPEVLAAARARAGGEAMLLSTCNRVEWYLAAPHPEEAAASASAFFLAEGDASSRAAVRVRYGADAVRHLFRVTSGLDSMLIGEAQILGQVRAAFAAARAAGTAGTHLDALLRAALEAGRRVRRESGIGRAADSVPRAAVTHARRVLGALAGRRVLVIGAGQMAEAIVRALARAGCDHVVIANRTPEAARLLAAEAGGAVGCFDRLEDEVRRADIVIASAASPRVILGADQIAAAIGGRRSPLLVVDIAVPRNVDPRSRELAGVHLYDIDDLQGAGSALSGSPLAERAERLVEAEVAAFLRARAARSAAGAIAAACAEAEAIVEQEWARARSRLALGPAEEDVVRAVLRRVARKILHRPISLLADAAGRAAPAAERAGRAGGP